ncbi:hypothetical protein C8R43DRAFT_1106457 [Mycena crocata]|nr:hypothetical protein C8R43DRAFT_1106457 [Mycena crocata]
MLANHDALAFLWVRRGLKFEEKSTPGPGIDGFVGIDREFGTFRRWELMRQWSRAIIFGLGRLGWILTHLANNRTKSYRDPAAGSALRSPTYAYPKQTEFIVHHPVFLRADGKRRILPVAVSFRLILIGVPWPSASEDVRERRRRTRTEKPEIVMHSVAFHYTAHLTVSPLKRNCTQNDCIRRLVASIAAWAVEEGDQRRSREELDTADNQLSLTKWSATVT